MSLLPFTGEHGRPITLPNHLINDVQSNLHHHLIKEQEAEENLDDDANKFSPVDPQPNERLRPTDRYHPLSCYQITF